MKKLALFIAAAALASAAQASSTGFDGNQLLSELTAPRGSSDELHGISYVQGFWHGLEVGGVGKEPTVCTPRGTVVQQVVDATLQELRRDISGRHHDAAVHIYFALMKTWPCTASARPQRQSGSRSAL